MPLKHRLQLFFFLVFFLPGLLSVAYSLTLLAQTARNFSDSGKTRGIIVRYDKQNKRRLGQRFCPVVAFPHGAGNYQFTDAWCNKSVQDAPPGTAVAVIFKASDPSVASIDEFMALYGKSLFVGVIGAPFLLLGGALLVRVRVR